MSFIKKIIDNRKLILQLGKNDFKNRFSATSLGAVWGFIQPFILMITYVIVFRYILRVGDAGDVPHLVWFLPGMAIWMFANEAILQGSTSIRNYSFLVKKVVFPVETIPVISIIASSFVGLFLIFIAIVVCMFLGFYPNILLMIYIIISLYMLILAIVRLTSTICTLLPDFVNFIGIALQLLFWFTPVVWNLDMLDGSPFIQQLMYFNPFTYLVMGFRSAFTGDEFILLNNGIFTIAFWIIILLIFMLGNSVFNRGRKDFADVL